jgi:hypothetical protein
MEDAEDGTFRNRMTAKGFFKSRNTLRAEEQERKKKQRKVSNKQHGEIVDLTSASVQNDTRRTEAATQHAEAASKQAEAATMQAITGMYQSQLEALQKAQSMGVTAEELRPFILKTLTNLYNSSDAALKQFGHKHEMMNEDAEVAFVEVRRSMEHTSCTTTSKETAPTCDDGACAAGDLCVETCEFKVCDNDEIWGMCNRHVHSVCMVVDDTKSACLRCYGFDEV